MTNTMNARNNHLFCFIFFLFILFKADSSFAQNDLTVNDFVFVCENSVDSIEKSLHLGTRAFHLELDEIEKGYLVNNSKKLEPILVNIRDFLRHDNRAIIPLIFKGNFNQSNLLKYLSAYFSDKFLFHNEIEWPQINELRDRGIQVLAIFDSSLSITSIEQIRKEKKYTSRFSKDPLDKIILFNSKATTDSTLLKNCFELWKSTGKPPNLIIAPKIKIQELKKIADSLNSLRRFRGIVNYNGTPLNEIFWVKSPEVITPARFSFPLTEDEIVLSPFKSGYRISPSEIIHNYGLTDNPRSFTAHDVIFEEKLVYDFSFEKEIVNVVDEGWDKAIIKNISFINDPERNHVLHLKTPNSFIDYSKENQLNFENPISTSVWIKPDSLPQFMGIAGFGMAFSIKLNFGNPVLTAATIKDHIIKHPLQKNKWSHLVIIYNPKTVIEFFLNGKKIGESITANIIPSEKSLIIGNNIWGEQFYGSIDDLKIWNRGLSHKEINTLYHYKSAKKNYLNYWIIGLLILIGLCLLVYFLKRKKNKVQQPIQSISTLKQNDQKHVQNTLHLFGNFKLNLISKKRVSPSFSPLQKQLLSYLILNTLEDNDGVNTNKLTDTFWPGVSKIKAKENRSGNIRKLRKVLSKIEGLEVVFEDKKWRVLNKSNLQIDIFEYLILKETIESEISLQKISTSTLESFLSLLKRGNILQNTQTEWADYFKNKISNEVENLLSKVYKNQHKNINSELIVEMANTILRFDSLNEHALKILIHELVASGKHGQAKNAYLIFAKNYEALYAQPFEQQYQNLVKS